MGRAIDIVKRDGKRPTEQFNRSKLHVRSPEGEAETIATNVCDQVIIWLEIRPEVTSADLRRKATDTLQKYHPEAAYLYKHHRLVI